jgi:hypothetical protein
MEHWEEPKKVQVLEMEEYGQSCEERRTMMECGAEYDDNGTD